MKIIILTLTLLYAALLPAFSQSYSGGSGTSGSPFQIATKADLKYLSEHSADWSKYFIQTADIVFEDADFQDGGDFYNSGAGFSPIGNSTTKFTGSYDGQGNVINGLYISREATDNIGLFGYVRTATIANITLLNANVTGNNYAAIAIGHAEGTSSTRESSSISNCYIQGNISGKINVGGLIGRCEYSNATITNCHANVTATSTSPAGGNAILGGLLGSAHDNVGVAVTNCSSSGSVSANGRNVGGFIGYVSGGTYQKCFSTSNVSINSSSNDGNLGGFIGGVNANKQSTTIQNCYALGNVTGGLNNSSTDWIRGVGGFIGTIRINYGYAKNITNCFAAGIVTQSGSSTYIGGFIGYQDPDGSATVTSCYWDNQRSTQATSLYGTGLTTAQMKVQGNFTSWDFANTWRMSSTITYDGYPTLEWAKGYATAPTSSQIADLSNLVYVAENSSRWATSYTQTADVNAWWTCGWDCQKGWTPIGNNTTKYTGPTYDGDDHEINHLFINRSTSDFQGLFGYLNNAEVKDLGLNHVNISARSSLAAIAGSADNGTIRNCFVTGKVAGIGVSADFTGGLIGDSRGNSLVENCYTNMAVSGLHHVGGLAGRVLNDGLTSIVRYCYSLGTVTGTGSHVGGLAGGNSGTITNSYSLVNVGGTGANVGGLVGNNWYGIITNSYSAGSVTGSSSLGGLVGATTGSTVTNSFWDTQTSGRATSNGGTGKTTTEMKTQNTFTDWDFTTIWNVSDFSATNYSSYPYLRSNEQTPLPGYENIAITWNGSVSSAWNTPGNWSNNSLPTPLNNITIAHVANHPVISSGVGASCNNLTVSVGATLTVESGGSLITNGTITNNGTINIEQSVSQDGKWHFISMPNANSTANTFLGMYLQRYDESSNPPGWKDITAPATALTPEQGYSLWVPVGSGTQSFTHTGTPNSGNQSIAITYTDHSTNFDGANLVGNPYPSYLDWYQVAGYGSKYTWNGDSYDAYTAQNGYGTGSRYVAPMEGFFVVTESNKIFELTNAMRTHTSNKKATNNTALQHGVVVAASNGNYSDALWVVFDQAASENFELDRDAWKLMSPTNGLSQLWSVSPDGPLAVDVRPETERVSLGFSNTVPGTYAISLQQLTGVSALYLEDTQTGTIHNFANGDYSFNYTLTDNPNRFKLLFGAIGTPETTNAHIRQWIAGNTLYISAPELTGQQAVVTVYSLTGQALQRHRITFAEITSLELQNTPGTVLVETKSVDGSRVLTTKGIIIK
ncbi:MAG: GLUG motif-containing protein [Bacteroidales bacterium]|nr:GLUG motif-containing protein [Bacteroidales bacterium]MDD3665687.1 GLUG motif-containing protein [Bacteroidales bacterium]